MVPTMILILAATISLAWWNSPKGARWLAQLLIARAAGLDAYDKVFQDLRPKAVRGRGRVIELEVVNQ